MPAPSSPPLPRHVAERRFHDAQAADRAGTFAGDPARLVLDADAYLNHETWVRPAFAALGPLAGRAALDYGCGHGMAAVLMARHGAHVTAFDLSPGYVRECGARAVANGVTVRAVVADGEQLPFPDDSFDAVWGNAVLHHLDLAKAAAELRRVLRPGGVAVFAEPWGGNPVLEFARRHLPYPGKHRTADERPLMPADLAPLRAVFPGLTVAGFQLFGMLRRLSPRLGGLDRLDARLLRAVPAAKNWCRYVVLTLPAD